MSRLNTSRAVDALLVVLTLGQFAELTFSRPDAASVSVVVLIVISTDGLLLRRRVAIAAVLLSLGGQAALMQLVPHGLATSFLTLMVTMVVIGALPRLPALAGLAGGLALSAEGAFLDRYGDGVADFALTLGVIGGAWVCGLLLARALQATAHAATELAAAELAKATAAADAVREERDRLTRELHDVVAHGLTVLVVQAVAAQQDLADGIRDDRLAQRLRASEEVARESLLELRTLLGILGTTQLTEPTNTGLAGVNALVERLVSAGFPVDVELEGVARQLGHGLDLTLYRIVQEGLTNACKHGDGSGATVRLVLGGEHIGITVENRAGRGSRVTGSGRGLEGLRQRVAQHDTTLYAGATGGVFRLSCELPVGQVSAQTDPNPTRVGA